MTECSSNYVKYNIMVQEVKSIEEMFKEKMSQTKKIGSSLRAPWQSISLSIKGHGFDPWPFTYCVDLVIKWFVQSINPISESGRAVVKYWHKNISVGLVLVMLRSAKLPRKCDLVTLIALMWPHQCWNDINSNKHIYLIVIIILMQIHATLYYSFFPF